MGCVLRFCREKMCVSAPKDLQLHMSLNKKHIQEAQIITPAAAAAVRA
jgi:hypothetical protein